MGNTTKQRAFSSPHREQCAGASPPAKRRTESAGRLQRDEAMGKRMRRGQIERDEARNIVLELTAQWKLSVVRRKTSWQVFGE